MDARGVHRLLEKIYGLAETATMVGSKSTEAMQREPRLSDTVKPQLSALVREEALRRTMLTASLGLTICRVIAPEADDDTARAQLEWYHMRFHTLYEQAQADLEQEFEGSTGLRIKD